MARATRLVRQVDRMNGTERAYSELLDARKRAGQVIEWWYEGLTLRLADDARYTPDFLVLLPDGVCELHEVKGFMREAARVRLRVCAASFPFRVRLATGGAGRWTIEEVRA